MVELRGPSRTANWQPLWALCRKPRAGRAAADVCADNDARRSHRTWHDGRSARGGEWYRRWRLARVRPHKMLAAE